MPYSTSERRAPGGGPGGQGSHQGGRHLGLPRLPRLGPQVKLINCVTQIFLLQ